MHHVIVSAVPGRFQGWPANTGIWRWSDEIVVGFAYGRYENNSTKHSIARDKPVAFALARSLDGGESWLTTEHPEFDLDLAARPSSTALDFAHPDFALRCWQGQFWCSYDRARTWAGPFPLGDLGLASKLTGRTDYLIEGEREALLFLSAEVEGVQAGKYKDRALCARTNDGGKTFRFLSWINDEPRAARGVMPSTVRVSGTHLVTTLRRRLDLSVKPGNDICWIDAYGSTDNGNSWNWLSRVAYTDIGPHNGNPPSLVRLNDGRLCVTYGVRARPFGMRAKLSSDHGATWGPEITLRDDADTWDFGYPRSTVRPDGKVVTVYYYNTARHSEQHIAATIWDPN